ncbi:MAG: hypothetical protein ACRBFS_13780 [Aureispira sp.]
MNTLRLSFVAVLFSVLFFTSCDKDSDCTAPALEQNIIGTWTADYEPSASAFEFKSDGTLSDPSDAVLGGEINGDKLTVKTYQTIGEDSLYVKAASATTTNFLETTFPVTKNDCDKITITIATIPGSFSRQ